MTTLDLRRKRLLYQSWHRGTKEADLILGYFAQRYLPSMTEAEMDVYESILATPDWDLYNWFSGRTQPPPDRNSPLLQRLLKFAQEPLSKRASPAT